MELEVGYSGERGLHLIRERSMNQAGFASPSNPIRGETTNTLANIPLRVPFEGWSAGNMIQIESAGASWYNALLVSLNKRFSHGLQFQVSYTFARDLSTDYGSTTGPNGGDSVGNQNDPTSRYGPDNFIRQHRFIVNYTYELPSGHTKSAFVHRALGGWLLAGVTTIQSGHLLTVTDANGSNIYGITNDRASLSATCAPGHYVNPGSPSSLAGTSPSQHYINTSCFAAPALINPAPPAGDGATGFGNSGVGILGGPGQVNFDIGILKHFQVHWPREAARVEFRTEFFNAFNHSQFGDPSTAFGTPNFGQITNTVVAPRILQFALKLAF
jgi:hypothetical protein